MSVVIGGRTRVSRPAQHRRPGTSSPGQGQAQGKFGRADLAIIIAILLLGVAIPAAMAVATHAFNIPRNDDWAYRRVLFDFARSGRYSLVGWGTMTLVGQILWATPFVLLLGPHPWVPGVAVAVTSVIGLGAAYYLSRQLLGRAGSAAVLLTLLVLPGFVLNTSSFMTDVPAFAADATCLALGAVALTRRDWPRWAWTAASMAVGILGFSVRQFDLAAPLAVLGVLAVSDGRNWARYAGTAAGVLLACGALYAWTTRLPGYQHQAFGLPTVPSLGTVAASYFTMALFVTPWLPRALARCWAQAAPRAWAAAALTLAGGALLTVLGQHLFVGDYMTRSGVTGGLVLFGVRPNLFPEPIWRLTDVVAVGAGAALAFVVASTHGGGRGRDGGTGPVRHLVMVFTVFNSVGLVVFGLVVRTNIWDRYLWPIAWGTVLLLASRRAPGAAHATNRRVRRPGVASGAAAGALSLGLVLVTAALTLNSDAYDGARWSAGQDAVKAGFPARTVDAGFEWVGDHASVKAVPAARRRGALYEAWYDEMFPGFRECAFVSGSLLSWTSLPLVRTVRYNELAVAIPEKLYVYATDAPGCP